MTDLHAPPVATPPPPGGRPRSRDEGVGTHPVRLLVLAALVVLLGVTGGWPMLVVVLGVVIMIFLHELGHFLAARIGGMKVTEFFIGFGPKIWSFRRGETEYGLKVIPAGAYVKIAGMNNLDEIDPADEARAYRNKSYPKRMLVAVAGSAMHFAQALILLFVLFAFVGVPGGDLIKDRDWEVREVAENSAAADAGLRSGDVITAIDGESMDTFTEVRESVADLAGETVTLTVDREGESLTLPTTLGSDPSQGLLGIRSQLVTTTVGPVDAVGASVRSFGDQAVATLSFFGDFFSPSGISGFASSVADSGADAPAPTGTATPRAEPAEDPGSGRLVSIVGAVQIGANLTENGMLGFLVFFVGINITIGIFNLLPVLPLDGGHVVVATYERLREFGRPKGQRYHVDFAKLLPVVYAVFMLLIVLGVSAVYLDISDPIIS